MKKSDLTKGREEKQYKWHLWKRIKEQAQAERVVKRVLQRATKDTNVVESQHHHYEKTIHSANVFNAK